MLALAALFVLASEGPLREQLQAPVTETFVGHGVIEDVELCVADAMFSLGAPTAFRDGENVVIYAVGQPYNVLAGAVVLEPTGVNQVRVTLRLRARRAPANLSDWLRDCVMLMPGH